MNALVHLELHTPDAAAAGTFYASLLGWRPEQVRAGSGSYLTLDGAGPVGAGVVECGVPRAGWLPYVAVDDVQAMTERAVALGASILLAPRDTVAGSRSVVLSAAGGEVAFWEPRA